MNAVETIDRLDYDFTKIRADLDESKNLSWIARARQFDDKIREHLVRAREDPCGHRARKKMMQAVGMPVLERPRKIIPG